MYLTHHQIQENQQYHYDIHPTSVKMIRSGHPWIIKDEYTDKFSQRDRFIIAKDRRRPLALFIHDPQHERVKARLWAKNGDFHKATRNFKNDLKSRLKKAFTKRFKSNILSTRNHFFLAFGEADDLPGILVIYLNGQILIQFSSMFWKQYEEWVIQSVVSEFNQVFKKDFIKLNLWTQYRAQTGEAKIPAKSLDPMSSYLRHEVSEFDTKFIITLGQRYDYGLYTDMANIRERLIPKFKNKKRLLNLYSYTGAFSLMGLKQNIDEVHSVDLSDDYLDELEDNIKLNKDLSIDKHFRHETSALEAVENFKEKEEKFDLIVCDPPTSSSDGNRRTNALKDYETLIPKMCQILDEDGDLIIFLNTHKVNYKKFERKVQQILEKCKNDPMKIATRLFLGSDCPTLKGFPEGSYIKGMIIKHDKGQQPKENLSSASEGTGTDGLSEGPVQSKED